MYIPMKKRIRGERGQIMALGALSVLLVALMMMLTMNVGQTVFDKIRLQQIADSAAFSNAVQEARAFNFFSYTNRANIGSLVAVTSAHSLMSMASSVPEMYASGETNFDMMAIEELILCMLCCWPWCFSNCEHCIHAFNDWDIASDYSDKKDDYRNKVSELDRFFKYFVDAADLHMYYLRTSQVLAEWDVFQYLLTDKMVSALNGEPKFVPSSVTLKNLGLVPLANSGIVTLPGLSAGYKKAFETDADKKKWVPTEATNGTLWKKIIYHHPLAYLFVFPTTLIDIMTGPPEDGITIPLWHEGQGRVIKDPGGSPESEIENSQHGPVGTDSAAYDDGETLSMLENDCYPLWLSSYESYVYSGPDGGGHENSDSCSGSDGHKLKCLGKGLEGGCFMLFKSNPSATDNYGQPVTYSLMSMDMRVVEEKTKLPWTLNDNGVVGIDLGSAGAAQSAAGDSMVKINIANNPDREARPGGGDQPGEGVALSKAIAYYHLPVSWKEDPNFFNPYWRAKLQPFRRSEANMILMTGGFSKYLAAVMNPLTPLP